MEGLSVGTFLSMSKKSSWSKVQIHHSHRHKAYILTWSQCHEASEELRFSQLEKHEQPFFGGGETTNFQKQRISSSQLDFSKEQRIFSEKKMKIGDELATMLRLESYITVFPVDTSGDGHEQGHHTWITDPGTILPQCHVSPKK